MAATREQEYILTVFFEMPQSRETRLYGSRVSKEPRHTTHHKDAPQTARVRNGHAFEGHELAVISRSRRVANFTYC